MTTTQMDLIIKLAGGLDAALAVCEAAGFEMVKNAGKAAKLKDLASISVADASEIIASLGRPAPAGTRNNLVSESQETNGYAIDRGEDN